MLPLRDNVPTRRFPVVTVALIAANFAVWILYQLPHLNRSVLDSGFFPCEPANECVAPGNPWWVDAFTSMFMHGGWEHILGNMLFLWIFGNNVEDTMGRARFVVFYVLGGLAATASQSFVTLQFGAGADARIPNVGASGAIAAVLAAYLVLFPRGRVLTWVIPFFFFELPALVFLGLWFVLQLFLGSQSFVQPESGGGVAFFAHIGGFIFGLVLVRVFTAGRPKPVRPAY
ncbi:MAG TPA: rhomboid family intramembrane serine protease [Gaiellaceae bacterium]|nr:rhomboid family intramembrane serine protease [Gaiellaceae bacterium]